MLDDEAVGGLDPQEFNKPTRKKRKPDEQPQQGFTPMFDDFGFSQALGAFNNAGAMHAMQGNQAQGAANDVMAAIQRENDSRVAQAREMRRMEHERQMKEMELNALIQRLDMERRSRRSQGGDGMGFEYDPVNKRWDRW